MIGDLVAVDDAEAGRNGANGAQLNIIGKVSDWPGTIESKLTKDGGGTLTHASIISREYRIPCVVGVGVATTVIRNGDDIEVDGTRGTVRIFRPND